MGSLQEQQNKRRTHLKLGVLCVLSVSVAGLMVMLIQGCKQKAPADDTSAVPPDTNVAAADLGSNAAPIEAGSNVVAVTGGSNAVTPIAPLPVPTPIAPVQQQAAPMPPAAPDLSAGGEYVVLKGDSLAKIAKNNHVSLKALEAANPGVKPSKLKIGQKLTLPAGGKTTADEAVAPAAGGTADAATETYTVKSGDTLTKIAKAHHVKLKELQAANGLTTTKIKVGEKLKIPAKGEVPAAPAPAAPVDNTPMAPMPAVPTPAAAPATPLAPVTPAPAQH